MFNKISSIFSVLFVKIQVDPKWFQMGSKAVLTGKDPEPFLGFPMDKKSHVSKDPVLLSHCVSILDGIPWSHTSVSMES